MTEKSDKLSLFDSHQVICDLKEYGVQVNLLFLRLNGCLFVWLGDEKSKLSGLSVCLPSQMSTTHQHSATIYSVTGASRNPFSEYEENLSCKISKRFNCPVFVSISLPYEYVTTWDNINITTQSTFGQKVEHFIFENLSTITI
ncbi:hypothetical protein EWB00_006636 [Schistosoma japonicum]|uniref:Proteasome assembly chaperone 4 n=1 Tax=Schistosoma japonicum TaxID=6182 RepID=A0A4Z2CXG7_SCHJA|nr:hypothetical protein KSF78_0009456 [Schistosoma japonicum]KAH8857205.1 hypothetical protein KSF78_0009456 [Schistosoma japonicum]TNN08929.1 hypothetical protein EWB00_006636 [Schistosoma japonicum]